MPTQTIELADPITYMKLENEAVLTRNPLGQLPYSQSKIDGTIAGNNPILYPANDWQSMLMKDFTMNQRVNLSVSGGGGVARYYVAASFNRDNGLLKVDKRNNFNNNIQDNVYNLRANVNIDLSKTTEMIVRLNGNFEDYTGPLKSGSDTYKMIMPSNRSCFRHTIRLLMRILLLHIFFLVVLLWVQKKGISIQTLMQKPYVVIRTRHGRKF